MFADLNQIDQRFHGQLFGQIFGRGRTQSIARIVHMQFDPGQTWTRNSPVVRLAVKDDRLSVIVFGDILKNRQGRFGPNELDRSTKYFDIFHQNGEKQRLMVLVGFDIASKVVEKDVRVDQR